MRQVPGARCRVPGAPAARCRVPGGVPSPQLLAPSPYSCRGLAYLLRRIVSKLPRRPTSKSQMDTLLQDLRYAVRTLVKNPGFAALTIVCLALGIGVNSTIFSVVDTVAIRPLPFRDPERLVSLHTTHQVNGIDRGNVSYLDVQDWKARTRRVRRHRDGHRTEPDAVGQRGARAIQRLHDQLEHVSDDRRPADPRPPDSSRRGFARAAAACCCSATASGSAGTRRDPSVVGRTVTVNGNAAHRHRRHAAALSVSGTAQLWVAQTPIEFASPRTARNLEAMARMKPGVSFEEARRDIAAIGDAAGQTSSATIRGGARRARSLRDDMVPDRHQARRLHDDGRGQPGAADRVRQRRQPAARRARRFVSARSPFARRSAPAAAASCGSCSPRAS